MIGQPIHDPDLQLIHAMAAGDRGALDELYARHGGGILSFLYARLGDRGLAEEVLQDVMLAAWRNASQFRGESRVRTWLLVIARNRALNALRGPRVALTSLDDVYEIQSPDTEPIERLQRNVNQTTVREAIRGLPAQQREVLVLVFYHQLSGPEVAQVLGITLGTVKSRLHRAKEALKRSLQSEGSF
jgi:RNA polymerase sigma-70 factor (ECF subfamily)